MNVRSESIFLPFGSRVLETESVLIKYRELCAVCPLASLSYHLILVGGRQVFVTSRSSVGEVPFLFHLEGRKEEQVAQAVGCSTCTGTWGSWPQEWVV